MLTAKRYGVFVVRIWREPTEAEVGPWCVSVFNTATKERTYFTSSKALAAFFRPQPRDDEALP